MDRIELTKDLANDIKEYLYQQIALWQGISDSDKDKAKELLDRLLSEVDFTITYYNV